MSDKHLATPPIELRPTERRDVVLTDGAWARPTNPQPGDVGASLAAVLKAMGGPRPIRDVRLLAVLVLEPRLFVPLLSNDRASEWRRLIGSEADPLASNVAAFAARNNAAWGAAVRNHRGNGRIIEDLHSDMWTPGPGLDVVDTAGWPDGRARFVLDAFGGHQFRCGTEFAAGRDTELDLRCRGSLTYLGRSPLP